MATTYHEEKDFQNIVRLKKIISELPTFVTEYFRGIADTKATSTRLVYAYDFRLFFEFLTKEIDVFKDKETKKFDTEDLDRVTAQHIELYMEHLTLYKKIDENGFEIIHKNKAQGKSRKLASIRTLYKYLYKREKIQKNPSELVDMPKITRKSIVRLENNEIKKLLNIVDNGSKLTKKQKEFHERSRKRDLAIVFLLLGTGMRVSECVGIDIDHLDTSSNAVKITRKGGDESIIYYNEDVKIVLEDYLHERLKKEPKKGHEKAFFISIQNTRLSDRAIQNLIKKYTKLVNIMKNITPHKLRSTYATNLYRETGDIYLVADVLGHADINTTRKHYAHMDEERRKSAASYIRLKD